VYWPSDPIWLDSGFWDWRPPWVRPMRPGTMRWALLQTQAPTIEPVGLSDVKLHLRVDIDDDDALIQDLIITARTYVERQTGLSLLPQTWELYLDRFPRPNAYEMWPWMAPPSTILIPRFPVQSITSLIWKDVNGGTNTVDPSTYLVDLQSRFPRLVPTTLGKGWPAEAGPPLVQQNGVVLTFTAGYASPGLVDIRVRQAIKLLVGLWYQNREAAITSTRVASATVPYGVKELLLQMMPPMVG
jgi:uncharacterized phiE125 gp8 family phage protein